MIILLHQYVQLAEDPTAFCALSLFNLLKHLIEVFATSTLAPLLGLKLVVSLEELLPGDI